MIRENVARLIATVKYRKRKEKKEKKKGTKSPRYIPRGQDIWGEGGRGGLRLREKVVSQAIFIFSRRLRVIALE